MKLLACLGAMVISVAIAIVFIALMNALIDDSLEFEETVIVSLVVLYIAVLIIWLTGTPSPIVI